MRMRNYIITVGRSYERRPKSPIKHKVQFNHSVAQSGEILELSALALNRLHYKTINYCEMVGISRPDSLVGEGV